MKGEIELHKKEDDIVEFCIGDTFFRVCVETTGYWIDEPDGYNSFTDEIIYKEYYEEEVTVLINTLEYEGELFYTVEEICSELTDVLNQAA